MLSEDSQLREYNAPPPPPLLHVVEWNTVGVWHSTEDCMICRIELEDACRYCISSPAPWDAGLESYSGLEIGRDSAAGEMARSGHLTDSPHSGVASHMASSSSHARRSGSMPRQLSGSRIRLGGADIDSTSNLSIENELLTVMSHDLASEACQFLCPVIEGGCGHIFHVHCLTRWVRISKSCPVCGRAWRGARLLTTNVKRKDLIPEMLLEKSAERKTHHKTRGSKKKP